MLFRSPVRSDVAGLRQLLSGRLRIRSQPLAHGRSSRVVLSEQLKIHTSATLPLQSQHRCGLSDRARLPSASVSAGWNLAEIWEHNADRFPDAPAQRQADRSFTWAEFDRRADGIAATLLTTGARHQDKVAQYLYNCVEYMESMFALYKAGLVPVNTNYRYTADELVYLWGNCDAVAVIFHGVFADRCAELRPRVPNVHTWIWVDDGSGPCP